MSCNCSKKRNPSPTGLARTSTAAQDAQRRAAAPIASPPVAPARPAGSK